MKEPIRKKLVDQQGRKDELLKELAAKKARRAERSVMTSAMRRFLKSDDAKLMGGMPKEFSYANLGRIHKQLDKRVSDIWMNMQVERDLVTMIEGGAIESTGDRQEGKQGVTFREYVELLQQLKDAGIKAEMNEWGEIDFSNPAQDENTLNGFAYEMKDRYKNPELGRKQEETNVKMHKVKSRVQECTYQMRAVFMLGDGKMSPEMVASPNGCYIVAQSRVADARKKLKEITADGRINVKRLMAAREVCKGLIALEPLRKTDYVPKGKTGGTGLRGH